MLRENFLFFSVLSLWEWLRNLTLFITRRMTFFSFKSCAAMYSMHRHWIPSVRLINYRVLHLVIDMSCVCMCVCVRASDRPRIFSSFSGTNMFVHIRRVIRSKWNQQHCMNVKWNCDGMASGLRAVCNFSRRTYSTTIIRWSHVVREHILYISSTHFARNFQTHLYTKLMMIVFQTYVIDFHWHLFLSSIFRCCCFSLFALYLFNANASVQWIDEKENERNVCFFFFIITLVVFVFILFVLKSCFVTTS